METEITGKLVGYHYSNPKAYRSMQTNGVDGHITFGFDNFAGLIPCKRFIKLGCGNGLPDEAHDGVIEGLLEPEPKSWIENPEFPNLWRYLMDDVCLKAKEIMLLSFPLKPEDRAYVVERAHIERELYRKSKGRGKPTKKTNNMAFKRYWDSRVPIFEYDGTYSVPQLAVWSGIKFDRLKVEWVNPADEIWKRVLENNW